MLELMFRLESLRASLRAKMLPAVNDKNYHLLGSILALIFASGSLATGIVGAPLAIPAGGFSFVAFLVAGLVSILTIVLLPIGFLLL